MLLVGFSLASDSFVKNVITLGLLIGAIMAIYTHLLGPLRKSLANALEVNKTLVDIAMAFKPNGKSLQETIEELHGELAAARSERQAAKKERQVLQETVTELRAELERQRKG
jgi:hypothetical protein